MVTIFSHPSRRHSLATPPHEALRIIAPSSGVENRTVLSGLPSPSCDVSLAKLAVAAAAASSSATSSTSGSALRLLVRSILALALGRENEAMAVRARIRFADPSV